MNKKFVIKTFKIMSMTIAIVIGILGVVLAVAFDEAMYTGFGIGIALWGNFRWGSKMFPSNPEEV